MREEDLAQIDFTKVGEEMYALIEKLFPICRSITGEGVRDTLSGVKEILPISLHEIPTGTQVFDWKVPKEWNIKDAYVKNSRGERVIDFQKSNLHVLNYSVPIRTTMSLNELKEHLFTLPDKPNWIPYLTSYYKQSWGFCLTQRQLKSLEEDTYEVVIDSSLESGSLTYGELFIPGESSEEVLISTYFCHPSMCNDNLSGVALTTFLAKLMQKMKCHYSYRFIFIPETIGAITWLSKNEDVTKRIKHGLVVTCVGDRGKCSYKKSKIGNAIIDLAVEKVLEDCGEEFTIMDFFPTGSDERQFCSPGFNLPVGSLMRTVYGYFDEYHTSADNLDFVSAPHLADMLEKYLQVFFVLEHNKIYCNLSPKGEPQLGRRGLYALIGGQRKRGVNQHAIQWVLSFCDGKNSLLDVAIRSKLPFVDVYRAVQVLIECELLREVGVA